MDAYSKKRNIAIGLFMLALAVGAGAFIAHRKQRQEMYTRTDRRLANFYFTSSITNQEAEALAKWDVVILGPEVPVNSPEAFRIIKHLHPGIILLAYFEGVSRNIDAPAVAYARDPRARKHALVRDAWLFKTAEGGDLSIWPNTALINPTDRAVRVEGERWQDVFPRYVGEVYREEPLWDGVFIDNALESISWAGKGMDIDHDGEADGNEEVDDAWREGIISIVEGVRAQLGDEAIVVTNSSSLAGNATNGRLFENAFYDTSKWGQEFDKILKAAERHERTPRYMIINANTRNTGDRTDERRFLFAYTSALLTDSYFSFDFGDQWHQQLWWYDEYDLKLGNPTTRAYMPDGSQSGGVWRRDFEHGIVLVNGTDTSSRISLDAPYHLPDRSIQTLRSLEIPPFEGRILLREP